MTFKQSPSALAEARATELARLREQFAFEGSPASSFALAKGLWQNGLYDEAFDQFTRTRDLAPRAPDASLSLIRAAISLARLDEARAALDHALAVDPGLPQFLLHQAQLEAADDPAGARDLLAGHRDNGIYGLFHDALDMLVDGRVAEERFLDDPAADAMWSGYAWLSRQLPRPRIVGTQVELLRCAVSEAKADGLVLECGVHFGRSLRLLAQWAGQRCHGFDSFRGGPTSDDPAADDPGSTAGVIPDIPGDVELHAGWLKDTLPAFFDARRAPIRLLHVDCEDHNSTLSVLRDARPWLREGSVIVFDDFIGYPGSEQHEFRAFHEFTQEHGLRFDVIAGVLLGREVAVRVNGVG